MARDCPKNNLKRDGCEVMLLEVESAFSFHVVNSSNAGMWSKTFPFMFVFCVYQLMPIHTISMVQLFQALVFLQDILPTWLW